MKNEIDRVRSILKEFGNTKIGILGDYCLDAYWILAGGEKELSLETGRPTEAVTAQRYSLGGAANVAANLVALGVGEIHSFAVIEMGGTMRYTCLDNRDFLLSLNNQLNQSGNQS